MRMVRAGAPDHRTAQQLRVRAEELVEGPRAARKVLVTRVVYHCKDKQALAAGRRCIVHMQQVQLLQPMQRPCTNEQRCAHS